MSDGLLSAAILARRHRPVASRIALNPLRRSMRLVTYWRTDRASKTADKYGTFLSFFYGIRTRRPSGAIRSEYLPNRGVQWLHVKPWIPSIVWDWWCCASAWTWASKRVRQRCICSSSTIARSSGNDGCRFGHHRCQRATDYIKTRGVDRKIIISIIINDLLR